MPEYQFQVITVWFQPFMSFVVSTFHVTSCFNLSCIQNYKFISRYENSTCSKIRWAMKVYVHWMNCRNYQVEHGLIPADRHVPNPDELIEMCKNNIIKVICMFILEVKDGSGNDYNHDTLYDLIVMVQSFFKQNGLAYKFFDDDAFFGIRNTLDNRMKALAKEGKVVHRVKAVPISVAEEEELWSRGILRDDTPMKLVNILLYLLGLHFGLHAADEHKNLKIDTQLKVLYDKEVGLKYLYYEELTSKCNQVGIASRYHVPKKGRAYENVVNTDRCLVRLYEKYVASRPSHNPNCSKDFYLHPLFVLNGSVWFSCQAHGHHALEKVIKWMCKEGGFEGKRTNHSCCATTATRMYESGADEQLICEKTGHRSVAVHSYKCTLNNQLCKITDMLYGNQEIASKKPKIKTKSEPVSTVSRPPLPHLMELKQMLPSLTQKSPVRMGKVCVIQWTWEKVLSWTSILMLLSN